MKFQIDGITKKNKGSELMTCAVLDQIEKRHPGSAVVLNDKSPGLQLRSFKTNLTVKKPLRLAFGVYAWAVLSRLKLPDFYLWFTEFYPAKDIDVILDAGGFRISDQWDYPEEYLRCMEIYYRTMKARGTKIVFLPQAFGPFTTDSAKECARIVNHYSDLIIARESMSKKYLTDTGTDPRKLLQYSDFTITTQGVFPDKYHSVKGGICIIPNRKMVTNTGYEKSDYIDSLVTAISRIRQSGKQVFLLNHEGRKDLKICKEVNRNFNNRLTILTGLNAKETKGVIGSSYLVISSRYHGVASSLNQGIPCLATSWSHKYQLLLEEYDLHDHIINIGGEPGQIKEKIDYLLEPHNNARMRTHLLTKSKESIRLMKNMWEKIWLIAEERNS